MESIGEPSALPLTRLSTLKLLLQRLEGKTANSNPRYRLMTTLATPVYDRRNFSNITEYILVNDAVWVERIKTVRTANILGVAGTDVPVKDFQKLIPAYKLGVNGYSFITTNNGYVLFHPDYRPIYQDILKPNFNAVDMSEVELVDTDDEPRNNDTVLMQMRREMIEKRDGEMNMRVRVHIDSMRRASIRQNRYFYKGIKETPFSLAIVQPEGYGAVPISELFKKKNWKVHPDWIYCQYMYDTPDHALLTPEAEVFHFMERSQRPAWKWRSRYGAQSSKDSSKGGIYSKRQNKDDYFCDKDLFQSLVFDAIATQPFDEKGLIKYSKSDGLGILKMFGVSIIFVATRSGLLKWHDEVTLAEREDGVYHPYGEGYENRHFSESNNGAIDEIWYKRAVEQNSVEPDSFVYSLPFDAGMKNDSLVTASHAIFVDKEGHKAPAAVVGLQFKHSLFVETFFNITHTCMAGMKCNSTCASEELECYVLDNNGFIIISEKRENSGKFFGEVDGTIMDSLVHYEIYQKIRIYDYQSVCFDKTEKKSSASLLLTPLKTIKLAASWAVGRLSWLVLQTQLSQFLSESWVGAISQLAEEVREEVDDFVEATDPNQDFPPDPKYSDPPVIEVGNPNIEAARINKTRVRPCDREVDLYALQQEKLYDSEKQQNKPLKGRLASCSQSTFGNQCGRSFTAHRIPHSNLILVVVDTLCPCDSRKMSIEPTEVYYNETERCDRLSQPLYRQRPTECISYHPEEEEIKMCGTCSKSNFSLFGLLLPLYVILRSILSS
ncbi:hypothetical protein QYM36_001414 [Artemia franciscana]|uniref:Voltage-dependent calcium channel alpha-2/delta subunit conserved region domain-containing protein n=1 Tax=Artemia franciscana TaxID=6661 RepID=A0AA88IQN4_ARTSF|nr:hypothetical protein QYM36_001414 [Artemia franciscana]